MNDSQEIAILIKTIAKSKKITILISNGVFMDENRNVQIMSADAPA